MEKGLTVFQINKIIVRYAVYATLLYVVYFLLMQLTGLAPHTELRFLNYFLYSITGYYALKHATKMKNNRLKYLQGIGIAFAVGALSFIFFAILVFLYSFFGSFFQTTVLKEFPTGFVYGIFQAPFLIASEGIGLSSIISLCLMQYFKIYSTRKRRFLFFGPARNPVVYSEES
jgi:hypothetical protein